MGVVLSSGPKGDVRISEEVVGEIVRTILKSFKEVKKLNNLEVSLYKKEMIVNLMIICKREVFIKKLIEEIQNCVNSQIKKQLGISVSRVNITIERFVG